ncbi:MAG: hypothetical protein HOO06_11445 [Bdellovibrionaceae bacterium]|jgi:hypothetical protein|nr:hypothetical protein [Pseudobdellovibrionaceae bacterium]
MFVSLVGFRSELRPISLNNSLFELEALAPKGSDMRFSPFGLRSELAFGAKASSSKRELFNEIGNIVNKGMSYACIC